QVLQRVRRNAMPARNVHGELLGVKVLDPAASRETDLRAGEELDVRRRVRLQRRDEHVRDVSRRDAEGGQRSQRTLVVLASETAALAERADPARVQVRQVFGRSR